MRNLLLLVGCLLCGSLSAAPDTYTVSINSEYQCPCGATCNCRIEQPVAVVKSAPVVTVTTYKVGDTIEIDGYSNVITSVVIQSDGRQRIKYQRPVQRLVQKVVDNSRGHWSYPGTINNHLQTAHGVNVTGMSREQMLNTHDSIHEASQIRVQPVFQSNCPGGRCPTNR